MKLSLLHQLNSGLIVTINGEMLVVRLLTLVLQFCRERVVWAGQLAVFHQGRDSSHALPHRPRCRAELPTHQPGGQGVHQRDGLPHLNSGRVGKEPRQNKALAFFKLLRLLTRRIEHSLNRCVTFIRLMLLLRTEEVEKRIWSFSSSWELRCSSRHSEIIHLHLRSEFLLQVEELHYLGLL